MSSRQLFRVRHRMRVQDAVFGLVILILFLWPTIDRWLGV